MIPKASGRQGRPEALDKLNAVVYRWQKERPWQLLSRPFFLAAPVHEIQN